MKIEDIRRMAHGIVDRCAVENYEYMKEYLIATNAAPDIREMSKLDMAKSMNLLAESENLD